MAKIFGLGLGVGGWGLGVLLELLSQAMEEGWGVVTDHHWQKVHWKKMYRFPNTDIHLQDH